MMFTTTVVVIIAFCEAEISAAAATASTERGAAGKGLLQLKGCRTRRFGCRTCLAGEREKEGRRLHEFSIISVDQLTVSVVQMYVRTLLTLVVS